MNDRIKEVRKSLGLNQIELGKVINLSQAHVSGLENGTKNLTDRLIADYCREFNVNENWLRTGEGEMFVKSDSTIIAELSSEYKLDSFDQALIQHYVSLDAESRQAIKNHAIELARKIVSLEEISATSEVDPIEQELESYRIELEAEEKGATSSAYDDSNEGKESS